MREKYDFSGWATKNDLKCSDGRTIRRDAFKDNDGHTVPLVWQHQHNDPGNVLGHALLENRDNGVYAYCTFNDTEAGKNAKMLVQHGDINSLSIYANRLVQKGGDVLHGAIREVSLVLTGANPGALIDFPILAHGEEAEDEAVIFTGEDLILEHAEEKKVEVEIEKEDDEDGKETKLEINSEGKVEIPEEDKKVKVEIEHASPEEEKTNLEDVKGDAKMANEKTVQDVFDELTEEQKKVVYFMIGQALEDKSMEHSDYEGEDMRYNIFEGENTMEDNAVLSHAEIETIIEDGKKFGSLKDSFLAHAEEFGIDNIEYLFPDAKSLNTPPDFIKRKDEWVSEFMGATKHTPFSRIKSVFANITEEDARAKGFIKGNMKREEVFPLLKRVTTPTTIYKKQKLDRDDVVDITDFDVVAWLKTEMRMLLDEEIARAALVGDGRSADSDDKINEQNVRPIWTDDDLFTIKQGVPVAANATDEQKGKAVIKAAIKARKNYKGSGNPTFFTTEDMLTDMLLIEDTTGRVIYDSVEKLATALRVKKIVTVPVMEGLTRTVSGVTRTLAGIVINPADYNFGADKGGSVNMFDDFDIDYNQQKYLIETRCSGALVKPYSAIALEVYTQS